MLESHECSSWESASGTKPGGSKVRAILNSLVSGQLVPRSPPRNTSVPNPRGGPELGPGAGDGAPGGTDRTAQDGSAGSQEYRSLTREDGGSSGPANGRSGDTKEPWRNFSSRSRRRSAGTAPRGPRCARGSASRRGRASAPGAHPSPAPGREPFPGVSKKCQVLCIPHPAQSHSPRRPGP